MQHPASIFFKEASPTKKELVLALGGAVPGGPFVACAGRSRGSSARPTNWGGGSMWWPFSTRRPTARPRARASSARSGRTSAQKKARRRVSRSGTAATAFTNMGLAARPRRDALSCIPAPLRPRGREGRATCVLPVPRTWLVDRETTVRVLRRLIPRSWRTPPPPQLGGRIVDNKIAGPFLRRRRGRCRPRP